MQVVWHEVRGHHFCQKCKKSILCLIAKLQITVLTFKQLYHVPDKLLYQPGEPDNRGGLQNVLMGQ